MKGWSRALHRLSDHIKIPNLELSYHFLKVDKIRFFGYYYIRFTFARPLLLSANCWPGARVIHLKWMGNGKVQSWPRKVPSSTPIVIRDGRKQPSRTMYVSIWAWEKLSGSLVNKALRTITLRELSGLPTETSLRRTRNVTVGIGVFQYKGPRIPLTSRTTLSIYLSRATSNVISTTMEFISTTTMWE